MELDKNNYQINELINVLLDPDGQLYLEVSEESLDQECGGYKYRDFTFRLTNKDAILLIDAIQTLLNRSKKISDNDEIVFDEKEIF